MVEFFVGCDKIFIRGVDFLFNARKLLNKSLLFYIRLQDDFRAFHYLKNKILSSQLLWFAF